MSLEDLILKGQCHLGHRSNFSEFLGSIWIKVGECMHFNENGYSLVVLMIKNDMHIRKFPRFP